MRRPEPLPPQNMREAYDTLLHHMREAREAFRRDREAFDKRFRESFKRRRPPKGKGGSEPVTVEPDRPRLGEGGAAVALEFDD